MLSFSYVELLCSCINSNSLNIFESLVQILYLDLNRNKKEEKIAKWKKQQRSPSSPLGLRRPNLPRDPAPSPSAYPRPTPRRRGPAAPAQRAPHRAAHSRAQLRGPAPAPSPGQPTPRACPSSRARPTYGPSRAHESAPASSRRRPSPTAWPLPPAPTSRPC
jgi:hypothetical protein